MSETLACDDIFDEYSSSRIKFPEKLWRIVNANETGSIKWGNSGKTILIHLQMFQAEYLECPTPVFKTRNFTSFVRQLNMYGFRKVPTRWQTGTSNQPHVHKFCNDNFQRDRPDLLHLVKRRIVTPIKKHPEISARPLINLPLDQLQTKFEQILMSTPEFLQFWCVSSEPNSGNSECVIKPKYQLTVLPTPAAEFGDNDTVITEISNQFQSLISEDDAINELAETEEDEDEDTDDGVDFENMELSTMPEPDDLFESETVKFNSYSESSEGPQITEEIINLLEDGDSITETFARIFTQM